MGWRLIGRWLAAGLAIGWIAGCGAHHGLDGDAGAADAGAADAGTDAASWVYPDTGPPPDVISGCTRDDDTVSGHAITPAGSIEGRQAWLWTSQYWGPPGPDRLVIASTTAVGPEPEEQPGALSLDGSPSAGQLLASIQSPAEGPLTATLYVVGDDGEMDTGEGATLTFENTRFDGRERIRGTLRLSSPGWDVDLVFDMPICGYLGTVCLC